MEEVNDYLMVGTLLKSLDRGRGANYIFGKSLVVIAMLSAFSIAISIAILSAFLIAISIAIAMLSAFAFAIAMLNAISIAFAIELIGLALSQSLVLVHFASTTSF